MKPLPGPETATFLENQPNLILGTLMRDGSPQASPVWYLWADGSFWISTIDTTAKWKNLLRDPRCSVCVDEPDTGRMVVAYGRARIHTEEVRARTHEIVQKYYYGDPKRVRAHMERIFNAGERRVLIEVIPERLIARRLDL